MTISGSFPGYSGMTRLLNRMADDKEITKTVLKKGSRTFVNLPQMFHLNEVVAPTLHGWAHELHAADIYVALETSGILKRWVYGLINGVPTDLEPDRAVILNSKAVVFWEVDEDNEGMPEILDKIARYIHFAKDTGRNFSVAFSAVTEKRESEIYNKAISKYPGGQFLVTHRDRLIIDPTAPVLKSPKGAVSLLDLM